MMVVSFQNLVWLGAALVSRASAATTDMIPAGILFDAEPSGGSENAEDLKRDTWKFATNRDALAERVFGADPGAPTRQEVGS